MSVLKIAIKRVISLFLGFLGFSFKYLRISQKGRVLFSQASERFNGNARYLFEYLFDNNWDVYWLSRTAQQHSRIPIKYKKNKYNQNSIKGFWLMLTAEKVVISHGGGDFGIYWSFLKYKKVLNVWHGTGIKCVGVLNKTATARSIKSHINSESRYYDAVTVASDTFKYLFSASHSIDPRRIHVTGDARTDIFIINSQNYKTSNKFRVLYAPTFRDALVNGSIFFPFADASDERISQLFENNPSIEIYLRPHPNDKHSLKSCAALQKRFPNNIILYDQTACDDIDSKLHLFDLIISDYSSIHLEPLLKNTPLIFVPFDQDEYVSNRGLAFNYDIITPGPKVHSFDEFEKELKNAQAGADNWSAQREFVKTLFFNYIDNRSRERIAKLLMQL